MVRDVDLKEKVVVPRLERGEIWRERERERDQKEGVSEGTGVSSEEKGGVD